MTKEKSFRHWLWTMDQDDVIHLTLDRAESSTNSLSQEVLLELEDLLPLIRNNIPRPWLSVPEKKRALSLGPMSVSSADLPIRQRF